MRYGIIGTGWIAASFIEGARLLCNAEIDCVYSRTEEKGRKFADENKIKNVCTDLDEFVKGDFEAVYIASPNAFHASQSIKMLESGKHVICEKPIAVNPDELKKVIDVAERKSRVYMEAVMYMHTPNRNSLKEAMKNLGRITSAHFDFSQLSSKYPAFLRGEKPNIFNPALATGCLMDLGVYCVYPALDLFGLPDKITADSVFLDTGADSSGSALLNYGDKFVTLTYSKVGQDYAGSCIYSDNGTIEIESISKLVNVFFRNSAGEKSVVCSDMPKAEIMGYEAMDFEKFIRNPGDDYYKICTERSIQASKVMYEIRKLSGIKFDCEEEK